MSALSEKVQYLDSILDTERIISGEKNSVKNIESYYKVNHPAYRRYHSRAGFMHFRVTAGAALSDDDIRYQPDAVSAYVPARARVLELGSGQGANLRYLAERRPDSFFCGVELFPAKLKRPPRNLRVFKQDYADLSRFPDGAFDTVYAIESLVHSSDKDGVFREIRRVLKPGGAFVAYDYALSRPYEELDPAARKAVALISKGGAAAMIESAEEWERHFTSNGFRREKITDLSKETLPDLERLARTAGRVLNHPKRAKFLFRVLPKQFSNNIVLGYLGYDACREGVGYYLEWVFRK